jgi:hypothetical protein
MCAFLARVLVCFALSVGVAHANESWTFCVAESADGHDIWITSVFSATKDRERLEADFKAYLERHDVPRAVAQCPVPNGDKTEVINAQFTAIEFHRKLGDALHDAIVPEFESKR